MKTYPEPLVARVLGPKKSILVEVRRTMLKKGEHWTTIANVVHYTEAGLAALCKAMELDHQPVLDEVTKNSAADAPPTDAGPAAPAAPSLATEATAAQPEASALPVSIAGVEKKSPKAPPTEPAAVTLAAQIQRAAAAPIRDAVDIIVTGRSPNPLIVFGTLEGQPVKVRVRNNSTFTRGLVLRAKPSSDGPFLMVGHPPRWLGDKIGFTRAPVPSEKTQTSLP